MTTQPIETPETVRIGSRVFAFTSYADISAAYCAARDHTGATASGRTGPLAPSCDIYSASGRRVAHVSYNGKVWAGDPHDWQPGVKPIFDPYAGA